MGADFGAIETILSLFLAGMFGVTGYMFGFAIALRGAHLALLAVVLAAAAAWMWIVLGVDYPHILAQNKAALVANATLWPWCLGSVCGFFITQRAPREQRVGDHSA